MILKLRKIVTKNSEKKFYKLLNNVVFEKTMESVRKYTEELVTPEGRRKYLVSKSKLLC